MINTQEYYKQLINAGPINIPLIEDVSLEQYRLKHCVPGKSKALGFGTSNPLIMFLCLEPNDYDLESGKPFTTKAGEKVFGISEYLNRKLSLINNTYYTCLFSQRRDLVDEFTEVSRFIEELGYVSPEYLVIFGEDTVRCLTQQDVSDYMVITMGGVSYPTFVFPDLNKLFFQPDTYKTIFKDLLDKLIEKCLQNQNL